MKHDQTPYDALEEWLDINLDQKKRDQLVRFETWLRDEAATAGGIGPGEVDRLFDRHIADSLAFLVAVPADAEDVVDVGGGVGLPSIPLAIVRPDLRLNLVDRSRKRAELAMRAARIVGIDNFSVDERDGTLLVESYDVALFRASLGIEEAAAVVGRSVRDGGIGLFAVSRLEERPSIPNAPDGITFALSSEGGGVLESPFWLLRMYHD